MSCVLPAPRFTIMDKVLYPPPLSSVSHTYPPLPAIEEVLCIRMQYSVPLTFPLFSVIEEMLCSPLLCPLSSTTPLFPVIELPSALSYVSIYPSVLPPVIEELLYFFLSFFWCPLSPPQFHCSKFPTTAPFSVIL